MGRETSCHGHASRVTDLLIQVVLLASRMGSLTQVDFTAGDVVSLQTTQSHRLFLLPENSVITSVCHAVWLPNG